MKVKKKKFSFLYFTALAVFFFIFSSLLLEVYSHAQTPAGGGGGGYEDYNNTVDETAAKSRPEKIVEGNIRRAYKALNKYAKDKGKEIADFGAGQKEKVTRFGNPGPEKNPLELGPGQGGHLSPQKSWNEYVMDSKIILNDETFPTCMEPRYISEKKDKSIKRYDPLNELYTTLCDLNCPYIPPTIFTPPYNRNWQVVSYYWPEYQVSVNKAGAQMIDADIVGEKRGQQELYRMPTSIKEGTDRVRGKPKQVEQLESLGIPASDSEKFKDPDYHNPGREFHLRQDGEIRYPSAMRPNAFWRAANARTRRWSGYKTNESCLFNALDLPTSQKKVIANRFDQGIYAILARYPEIRKKTDEERYQFTSPKELKIENYKQPGNDSDWKSSLCASWRMGSNSSVYGELEKVGMSSTNNKKYLDYCLPGGYDLSGSMVATEGTPMLQADAARVAMSAIWFGSKRSELQDMNTQEKRTIQYSFYKKRQSSKVNRYVGLEENPGDNESKVVFVDKMQRIYPTQSMLADLDGNGSDGKMGASSKNFRVAAGQRGSQCFRPEDIPNWSSEGKTNKSEWPLGLMGGVKDHYGETRWAIWNRRIVCSCEDFGILAGCLNMNDGDSEETVFAGTLPTGELTPAFAKAFPKIRGFATQTSKPGTPGKGYNGINLNSSTVDVGRAGSYFTTVVLPQGQTANFTPDTNEDPSNYLICMAAGDRGQDQQQQNGQGQQGQGQQGQQGGTNTGAGANPGGGATGGGAVGGGAVGGGGGAAGGGAVPGTGGGGDFNTNIPGLGGGGGPEV